HTRDRVVLTCAEARRARGVWAGAGDPSHVLDYRETRCGQSWQFSDVSRSRSASCGVSGQRAMRGVVIDELGEISWQSHKAMTSGLGDGVNSLVGYSLCLTPIVMNATHRLIPRRTARNGAPRTMIWLTGGFSSGTCS